MSPRLAGKDNLTLQSKKPLAAVIQAPAVMTSPKAIVRVQAQNAEILQFTIQGARRRRLRQPRVRRPG
ncbi:MAG: hypothetical protein ACXVZQ_00725 [Terriglobales bacterium]